MVSARVREALWKAAEDSEFRRRTLANLGMALAEEGFILTDDEMATMRSYWESLVGLTEPALSKQVMALARANPR